MRRASHSKQKLSCCIYTVWLLIIATVSAHGSVKIQLRGDRPVVDGIYVNGHGPYRFLLDTGSNINLIDVHLASKIGLIVSGKVELTSAGGESSAAESDGNESAVDIAKASGQRFVISSLDAIHNSETDAQGVHGMRILSQFDFAIDLQCTITFGVEPDSEDPKGYETDAIFWVIATSIR